jgi:hypothetical protein
MPRLYTLFTGQWADLPFEEVARLVSGWGYDGPEIAVSGDHLDACELGRSDSTPSLRGCGSPTHRWPHQPPTETPATDQAAASSSPRAVCGMRSRAGTALVRCRRSFRQSSLLRSRACCVPTRVCVSPEVAPVGKRRSGLGQECLRCTV